MKIICSVNLGRPCKITKKSFLETCEKIRNPTSRFTSHERKRSDAHCDMCNIYQDIALEVIPPPKGMIFIELDEVIEKRSTVVKPGKDMSHAHVKIPKVIDESEGDIFNLIKAKARYEQINDEIEGLMEELVHVTQDLVKFAGGLLPVNFKVVEVEESTDV